MDPWNPQSGPREDQMRSECSLKTIETIQSNCTYFASTSAWYQISSNVCCISGFWALVLTALCLWGPKNEPVFFSPGCYGLCSLLNLQDSNHCRMVGLLTVVDGLGWIMWIPQTKLSWSNNQLKLVNYVNKVLNIETIYIMLCGLLTNVDTRRGPICS